jgi:hypothetical protein
LYDHVDIYLDESGDLGFNPTGSKYFVVGVMATTDTTRLNRLVKRGNRKFGMKEKGSIEFKFNKSRETVRQYFLKGIADTNSWIVWKAIQKENANADLRLKKDKLYHYVCGSALEDIFRRTHAKEIHVILDRRQSKRTLRNDLDRYIEAKFLESHAGYFSPKLTISHFDSTKCESLQVHDFAVGSIFQGLERHNQDYTNVIKEKIVSGSVIW